nr:LapA family protein [Tropicimonas sp. IMCC34043]
MRFLWYVLLAVIVACLVVMAMANRDFVTLTLLPPALAEVAQFNLSVSLPLYFVALGGVAVGLLIGFFLEWMRESKHRSEVAKRQRQVRSLNREVNSLKGEKHRGKDEVLALLEESPKKAAI